MSTETYMRLAVSLMVNAVLFGTGAIAILSVPALSAKAATLLPFAVAASIVLTPPLAAMIAPRMRLRHQRVAALRARYRR